MSGIPTPTTDAVPAKPVTQQVGDFRERWPAWVKQLPRLNSPQVNPDFQLIDPVRLEQVLKDADPDAVLRIKEDIKFMDHELLRLFRERDHEASVQQNRYRLYQIGFIILATIATLIGSIQALALSGQARWVPVLAFCETIVALIATFLATISGREPPFPLWLANRRRAESLRREYFRYLMHMPPYDDLDRQEAFKRRATLSARAADMNRGVFPDETVNN